MDLANQVHDLSNAEQLVPISHTSDEQQPTDQGFQSLLVALDLDEASKRAELRRLRGTKWRTRRLNRDIRRLETKWAEKQAQMRAIKPSEVPLSKSPSAGLSAQDEEGGIFAYFLHIDGLEAALQLQRHELECALRGGTPKQKYS